MWGQSLVFILDKHGSMSGSIAANAVVSRDECVGGQCRDV